MTSDDTVSPGPPCNPATEAASGAAAAPDRRFQAEVLYLDLNTGRKPDENSNYIISFQLTTRKKTFAFPINSS